MNNFRSDVLIKYTLSCDVVTALKENFLYRAMLELDQILRANEINFAVLAALPAFFLSLVLLMLVRAWVMQVGI